MNQIDKTITAMYKSLPIPIPTNWNPYIALDYFQHGNPDENTYREKAIAECAAAGKDCIAVKMAYVPNPELSIHLLWYESDVEKGKFMGTWYVKAKDRGITKWQIDITGLEGEATTIYDRFKAYPAYTVKFVTPDISMLKGIDRLLIPDLVHALIRFLYSDAFDAIRIASRGILIWSKIP
jgi:hypothetical protein